MGAVFQEPVKGGFQSGTLAPVVGMVQKLDLGMGSRRLEKGEIFLSAAVVDQNDIIKACLDQSFYDPQELFVRIQRRQHHTDL
jgi:hypothetical protein